MDFAGSQTEEVIVGLNLQSRIGERARSERRRLFSEPEHVDPDETSWLNCEVPGLRPNSTVFEHELDRCMCG